MDKKNERNSSLELLRILSIVGIVCMHSFSHIWLDERFMILSVAENSLFNIGVTCFILISGYFGIQFSIQRLLKIEALAVFGGLLTLVLMYANGHGIGYSDIMQNIFPVIARRYWFISCYVCLVLFAPFLNRFIDFLSHRQLFGLILILVFLFYLCPTFFYFQIVPDSGKGLTNVVIMYLLGRYFRLYPIQKSTKMWVIAEILFFVLTFCANIAFILLFSRMELPFSRDNSLFILLQAIAVFHLFSKFQFVSRFINKAAGFVFAVCIFNSPVLTYILPHNTAERLLSGSVFQAILYIVGNIVLVLLICVLIECLRRLLFSPIEKRLFPWVERVIIYVARNIFVFVKKVIGIEDGRL